jgi:hypothetical protein
MPIPAMVAADHRATQLAIMPMPAEQPAVARETPVFQALAAHRRLYRSPGTGTILPGR